MRRGRGSGHRGQGGCCGAGDSAGAGVRAGDAGGDARAAAGDVGGRRLATARREGCGGGRPDPALCDWRPRDQPGGCAGGRHPGSAEHCGASVGLWRAAGRGELRSAGARAEPGRVAGLQPHWQRGRGGDGPASRGGANALADPDSAGGRPQHRPLAFGSGGSAAARRWWRSAGRAAPCRGAIPRLQRDRRRRRRAGSAGRLCAAPASRGRGRGLRRCAAPADDRRQGQLPVPGVWRPQRQPRGGGERHSGRPRPDCARAAATAWVWRWQWL